MSRCYADRVEVLRRNEEPAHFLWRSRLYVVRGVLAHWVETGEWWRSTMADVRGAEERPGAQVGGGADGDEDAGARRAVPAAISASAEPAAGAVAGADGQARATAGRRREYGAGAAPPLDDLDEEDPLTALDEEHEIWRVEASSGRSGTPGVYDLCLGWSSGSWTLVQTAD